MPREVTITINVDTGDVSIAHPAEVQKIGADLTKPFPSPGEENIGQEIAGIRRGTKAYRRIAEILHTTSSPGCIYWDGVRWIKFC